MADEAKPCGWKFLSVFARLKNKFDRKRDEYFYDLLLWPSEHEPSPPHPAPEANYGGHDQPWAVPAAGQHDNEASASNQNSQYFDAEFDASAYWNQFQIPSLPPHFGPGNHSVALQHGVPVVAPSSFQQGLEMHTQQRGEWTGRGDGMLLDQPAIVPNFRNQSLHSYALHNQMQGIQIGHQMEAADTFSPGISVDDSGYGTDSEFSDAVLEWQRDDSQMVTSQVSASYQPSMSMMSVGTRENLRDTGESSLRPAQPDENQIMEQYIRDLKIELGLLPARPWHVIAFIKKLSGLWRVARQRRASSQAQAQAQVCGSKVRRIRFGEDRGNQGYKGIRQRKNGKWVAEIRIGTTKDKVWLGSFLAEKEAALAYDAGLHHCSSKKNKSFNFKESPQKLGPSQHAELVRLEKEERKRRIQRLAEDHARAHGSTNIR